jgi:DNA-binding Lrp family transcriptional regulator
MFNLDKRDIGLIKALDFDARASISSLGKRMRVSKEVANYRLKRLIEEKIIRGFVAIIDSYMLGYQLYRMQVRFKEIDENLRQEVIEWAKKHASVAGIVSLDGKWDFELSFWAKNPSEFNQIYEAFIIKFGSHILRKIVSIILEMEHRPYNFLYEKPNDYSLTVGCPDNLTIDKVDYVILDILSKNCRAPLTEIAKKVGVSANAVKYRIKNLEKKKIIKGYSTIINNNYFNLNHYRVLLFLSDPSKKKIARSFLLQQKDVIFITQLIGAADIKFEILCSSPLRVYKLIDELNHLQPGLVRDFDEIIIRGEEIIDYFPNR